ncbi:MAG: D-2-hydroxyacid dehydrogenase, partial [Pyrinomonadaceae bacterium]
MRESLGDNELILFAPQEDGARGEAARVLREADGAFGALDAAAAMSAENLKWIELSSAGYAPYDRADFKKKLRERDAILTNSSAVYNEPCAQHVLAMMLGL